MRDFDNLPLLTPYEAFERAWETDRRRPTFDFDYRVRGPKAWKTIETLLRQYDVEDVIIGSFGLRNFEETLEVCELMADRGWSFWPTSAIVYVGGERRYSQVLGARYSGD